MKEISVNMKSMLIIVACLNQAPLITGRAIRSKLDSNDSEFANECDPSNDTSAIGSDDIFECGSGFTVKMATLCDANSDCIDMHVEIGCVDCTNRYNKNGVYTNGSLICTQTQSYCRCVQVHCRKEDGITIYRSSYDSPNTNKETTREYWKVILPIIIVFLIIGSVVYIKRHARCWLACKHKHSSTENPNNFQEQPLI